MRKLVLSFSCLVLTLFFFELFISSCASRSNPSGGPKDTLSPKLDTSFPANFSTGFKSNEIELIFDEYLNLKSPGQQIMVSPPLNVKPDINLRGRSIFITFEDTLLKNTTYTISFGTAITDYTEGNVNKGFKYVFSTGTYIDSLSLEGSIIDAYTGEVAKDLLVALYELKDTISIADSIPFKRIPTYYSYLDEEGQFKMENLKSGNFKLFAFEDKRNSFKPDAVGSKIAFKKEFITITDSAESVVLRSFKPTPEYKFYGARHKQKGLIQFNFNRPVKDIGIERLPEVKTDSSLLAFNTNRDTVYYRFRDQPDSIVFLISGYKGIADTTTVFLREYDTPKLNLTARLTKLRAQDTLYIRSNIPVKHIHDSLFMIYSATDTFKMKTILDKNLLGFKIIPEKKQKNYTLELRKGAVKSWFNNSSDSLKVNVTVLRKEDLGSVDLTVKSDSLKGLILEIYDASEKRVFQEKFNKQIKASLRNYIPGIYRAQIIVDTDGNGKWSSGDYFKGIQPERILRYTEPVEIRANWELELEWIVKP